MQIKTQTLRILSLLSLFSAGAALAGGPGDPLVYEKECTESGATHSGCSSNEEAYVEVCKQYEMTEGGSEVYKGEVTHNRCRTKKEPAPELN